MVASCRGTAAAHCGELTAKVFFNLLENDGSDINADLEKLIAYFNHFEHYVKLAAFLCFDEKTCGMCDYVKGCKSRERVKGGM